MNRKKKLIILILFIGSLFSTFYPPDFYYSIRGVDVSHHQGDIDWQILSEQNIDFAFIKATEGSNFVDPKFKYNWKEASKTKLKIGAYHFFSYDSSAKTQVSNFIHTVENSDDSLPPVIDIEFYGNKEDDIPDIEYTRKELQVMLDTLEKHYRKKPIIYATMKSYHLFIKDYFASYPLWIRNIYYSPNIDLKNKWVFWQYTDTAILNGYNSVEKYIDLNVFNGQEKNFVDLILY